MKMKKTFAAILASVLSLSLPLTATAATWDNVDDYDKLSTAFGDTESEIYIIVTGDIVNENGDTLTTGVGQTYTIDGKEYVLTDVIIGGSGDVVINADLEGKEDAGLTTNDEVSVTVNGDVNGKEMDGIDANDATRVTVNGDVKSDGSDGLDLDDEAQVIVNGDVYGGAGADGVDASDDTKAIVNGDVYGGNGQAPDEDGNLAHGNINDPSGYSDGGAGIEADKNAEVYVDGSVYGGDSYGTYSYAGAGLDVVDSAKVEITGNTQGGDQITNPDVATKTEVDGSGVEYTTYGYAGDGVYMDNTADVTVGGDAIGGNASGQEAVAGSGAYIQLTFTAEPSRNPENGETVANEKTAGKLTVKGTLIGGDSTGKNGEDGAAIFYAAPYDLESGEYLDNPIEGNVLPDEMIEEICSNDNLDYIRMCVVDAMPGMISDSAIYYVDFETGNTYMEDYKNSVKKLAEEYGVDTETITDFEEIVGAISDEKIQEFAKKALNIGNDTIKKMALEAYAVPMVMAGALEAAGDGELILAETDELIKYIADNYVEVENVGSSNGTVGSDSINPDDTPKTGDSSLTGLMSGVLIVSALGLFVVGKKAKKR